MSSEIFVPGKKQVSPEDIREFKRLNSQVFLIRAEIASRLVCSNNELSIKDAVSMADAIMLESINYDKVQA